MTHPLTLITRFNRIVFWRTRWGNLTGRALFDALLIIAGASLMALAIDVFLDPNDVVPGGFTALAMFANRLWGWPVGLTLLALNAPFLLIGMMVLGVGFGPRTLFAAAFSALAIDLFRPFVPVVQGEPLLYTLYGGLVYGAGLGLVFRAHATTGGTEIPAKLFEHFYGTRMSASLLAMDVVVLALAAVFFGLAPALYALIVAWVSARIIDFIEAGLNAGNTAFIITAQAASVRDGILHELDRGVTLLPGEGGYTGSPRTVLMTVVTRRQVSLLREVVRRADADAFVVITPSHEVLGEGFKPLLRGR